jgi:hypothetical protein
MRILNKILTIFLLLIPIFVLGYAFAVKYALIGDFSRNQPFEMIADMDNQIKVKPQSPSSFFPDSLSQLTQDENVVNRLIRKYKFTQIEFEEAEKELINPLPHSEFVLARGKNRFETFCVPCHGISGLGDGTVITKVELGLDDEGFPGPASYLREDVMKLSDGRLFHILSAGQNLMSPVADRLSVEDRWCLVHYIRYLQGKVNEK